MEAASALQIIIRDMPLIVGCLSMGLVLGIIHCRPIFYSSLCCIVLILFLCRNPVRLDYTLVIDPRTMLAPADGKIVNIAYAPDGSLDGYHYCISIVSSLLDIHINRVLCSGVMSNVIYRADNDHVGKHCDVDITCANQRTYRVRHSAWPYLSHFSCWSKIGDAIATGQAYGIAIPRSRCDIFLPENVSLCVGIGQYVYAGTTKIGCWTA